MPSQSILIAFFLFFLCSIAFASSIDDAQQLERDGRKDDAIVAYEAWLSHNGSNLSASSVLVHAASLFEDPLKALFFLKTNVTKLPKKQRDEVLVRIADLGVILGLPHLALEHFALLTDSDDFRSDDWRIQQLILRFSMGEEVRSEALILKQSMEDAKLISEAGLIAALSLAQTSGAQRGISEILKLIEDGWVLPSTWLYLTYLYSLTQDNGDAKEALDNLKRDFPDSIHLHLAESRIIDWETPFFLIDLPFNLQSSQIQVGAFELRSRAVNLREQLENDGFTAWIENQDPLWKVLVYDSDGSTALRLSKKGYATSIYR